MNQTQKILSEIAGLKRQSSVDFEFTALAMKDMGNRINAFGREMQEGFDQLAGRMRLQDKRMTAVLQAVERTLELQKPEIQDQISDLERRIQALEDAKNSAA